MCVFFGRSSRPTLPSCLCSGVLDAARFAGWEIRKVDSSVGSKTTVGLPPGMIIPLTFDFKTLTPFKRARSCFARRSEYIQMTKMLSCCKCGEASTGLCTMLLFICPIQRRSGQCQGVNLFEKMSKSFGSSRSGDAWQRTSGSRRVDWEEGDGLHHSSP